VVEDDEGVREGLSGVLRGEGYEVVTTRDGQAAMDYLKSATAPRMIILDFMMPRMDGWAFLKQIRENEQLLGVPVLGMSASHGLADRRTVPSELSAFFRKPFHVEAMLRSIEQHCGR